MNKPPLLFLCHRIPFPPNKGDKIRSFNILQMLNKHYDVYLGCFIDDPYDEQYVDELKKHCHQLFYRNQNKLLAKLKGMTAFLTGKPITLPYYYDQEMAKWCQEVAERHAIQKVFVYSSSMAQYCETAQFNQCQRVIDFVDVDSDKWRQYAENKSGLAKFIFQREFKTLARYEDKVCQQFDASLFVSPDEAKLFRSRQQVNAQAKVQGILNGVDIGFFNPSASLAPENKVPDGPFISFTGAMDYWANVDAVLWFAENVWPIVKKNIPSLSFVIAGGNPTNQIKSLATQPDVIVTGRVEDIRPYITQAACIVAPLRIARGIQNKVLEAMSLDKPLVCTSMAMEGINAPHHQYCQVHDEPEAFAKAVIELVNSAQVSATTELVTENRAWIKEHFTWQATLAPLAKLYQIESSEVTSQ
ncbi:TIGR03087 family PEP-CTERM/XrtA system glycosyltransferase [Thalassotalea euphylliae]|uniref:TIGR03087 family PEP-CTERM/XrtA system glycosyltransferase n=1 Tax=Thalassotalea euphylliae TaxID=1655234 RepID=A0A3E0U4M3_9GAMM|nr:TIGR03087 family PEP-CTERM/XrtA system glycosyltransferase [Thalassotalea euphylliae]REL31145.1 TIGR03087 family PEP-CTERM/XrtA system glycosyltransferase [Thalassotalea euphylliae]